MLMFFQRLYPTFKKVGFTLFFVNKSSKTSANYRFIKRYDYFNIKGEYTFSNLRFEAYEGNTRVDKTMRQGIFDFNANKFSFGLNGRQKKSFKAMYGNLKDLEKHNTVYLVEGEKDVDTLNQHNMYALTVGSSDDWSISFSQFFNDKDVIVIADNDPAGVIFANNIITDCKSICKSIKKIIPSKIEKGDITDYLTKENHTIEDFQKLVNEAKDLKQLEVNVDETNINTATNDDYLDKIQFHLTNGHGTPTGVFDVAIENYIIEHQKLFIYGGIPFLYKNGCYFPDRTKAELSTSIRNKIFDNFIKSTTLDRIYRLFLRDARIQKDFEEINVYPEEWICFKNGMYDPINKKLIPHNDKYYCINQIPHEYYPDKKPQKGKVVEEYLNFICDGKEDTKEMLLQFMGYSLTRDTRQQKFLILTGEGGSGKSTLIKCFELLVGRKNIANVSLTDLQQRFSSIELMGMLVNSCADLEIGALKDTSMIKKIVGQDFIKGERKGKDLVFFKNYAKLIFSTNELPVIKNEKTSAFYRRLLILPMNKKPEHKDPNLFQKLAAEKDYLLMLAVQALERMHQQINITISSSSEYEIEKLRADSDTAQAFINECCIINKEYKVEKTDLHNNYLKYCEEYERTPLTKQNFYKSIIGKGFKEYRKKTGRYFEGLDLVKNCSKDFIEIENYNQEQLPF